MRNDFLSIAATAKAVEIVITSRQLYVEESAPRPLMPARPRQETPMEAPVKFATIIRKTGRESDGGRIVEKFTAVDVETGEIIAEKQVKEWVSVTPSRRMAAEKEVRDTARAAGYTVKNEG